jgi:hypothetical protein
MSIGITCCCPCCWEDIESCRCTSEELIAYHTRIEESKRRMKESVDSASVANVGKLQKEPL